jgi:hypothetical protein
MVGLVDSYMCIFIGEHERLYRVRFQAAFRLVYSDLSPAQLVQPNIPMMPFTNSSCNDGHELSPTTGGVYATPLGCFFFNAPTVHEACSWAIFCSVRHFSTMVLGHSLSLLILLDMSRISLAYGEKKHTSY